ncbi:hypothetical protein [Helicobacter cetorum]|uniref:Phage-Barnase-EndoU-ColicinE5/D-RelE like nuclease 3 domain-containing protein n=1 Tax=Helicobacter cetorum (strain ATCC BAA-429 / MIT 00-7128) TaxID=182217 RepID=I0ELL1_HELC0|nr:hypothetical protein [Helicobacter cetorum]AFI03830.1 hypothetical protein HCW_02745 [Helicobacter cetorum MIT 00-7128]
MATLDFKRLKDDNISPKSILNFVKNQESNFNYNELENYYKDQGLKDNDLDNALYNDLTNFKDFKISLKPINSDSKSIKSPLDSEMINKQKQADLNLSSSNIDEFELKKERILNTLNSKAKELKESGLLERLGKKVSETLLPESFSLESKSYKDNQQKLEELKEIAIKNNVDFKDLPKNLQDSLRLKRNDEGLFLGAYNALKENFTNATEVDYNKEKALYHLARSPKSFKDLNDKEKALIKSDRSLIDGFFDSFNDDEKALKEWKENHKAKDITKEFQKQKVWLDNIHSAKSLGSLFLGASKEEQENYKETLNNLAKLQGFDKALIDDKGAVFLEKDNESYKVNDGFFSNFLESLKANSFSVAGGVIGSLKGASNAIKKGKINPLAIGVSAGLGGAIGSGLGGITDATITNLYLNREQNLKETLKHGLSEGLLSLAGDVAIGGATKALKELNAKNLKKGFDIATSLTPFVGTFKRAMTGNTKRAEEILLNAMSKEEQDAIKEFSAQFGGNAKFDKEKNDLIRDNLVKRYGEDNAKIKAYDSISNAIKLTNFKEQQEAFIRAIRADESGNVIAFLSQAANESPRANLSLKNILNKTTKNLEKQLDNLNLDKSAIKSVLDDLDKGTKESYDNAINKVIAKVYDTNYILKPNEEILNLKRYEKFRKELQNNGELEESALKMLHFLERNIYNPNGVNFTQLHNAKNTINAYLRNIKDPSIKGHIQREVGNFIKNDIENATNELFKLNKSAYKQFSELYNTAISDYKNAKSALKLSDEVGLRNKLAKEDEVLENLLNLAKGQGEKNSSNFSTLTKGLNEQNKEILELNMLNRLMQKSMQESSNLRVFDSEKFLKNLESFKDDVFTTKGAKDFIDLTQGFHKLFKNDVLIAKKLTEATTQKASQGLATSLEGAFKFLGVKWLLNTMYRTAPKTFIFKSLDEKTAGAALRYHLKQALERSHSVEEFTNTLKLSAQKSKFSNETMKKIEEITSGVKTASEEVKDKITKHEKALKELEKIDTSKLTKEQLDVLKVFKGELDETILKGRDLNDLYTLEKGSKKHGAIKILKRHYGENKTGAITSDELLNMGEVIKNGSVLLESKENRNNLIRYAYEWDNNGVKLRVVVDDLGDNKKIFNFYSDRPTGGSPTPRSTNQQIDITQKELTKQDQELSFLELANLEKQQKLLKEQQNTPKNTNEKETSYNESLETKAKDEKMPKLSFNEIKKLIDKSPNKGREMLVLGEQNLTSEVVEYIEKNNKKIAVEKLEPSLAKELGLEYPNDAKTMIDFSAIKHILNRHGKNSNNVIKSKQPPITYDDIANYRNIVENADETLRIRENDRVKLLSYKQINGYFVVVEQVSKKQNGLSLVTMFKENGDYRNSKSYLESIDANNLHSRL